MVKRSRLATLVGNRKGVSFACWITALKAASYPRFLVFAMMDPATLTERLIYYFKRLEEWKRAFAYLEGYREPLPPVDPPFALKPGPFQQQLSYAVTWLDTHVLNNTSFTEEYRANIVYTVFDELDLALTASGDTALHFLGGQRVFVNAVRFWKPSPRPHPLASATRSFESFGQLDWDATCQLVELNEEKGAGNPLHYINTLRVGLFPLTPNFKIRWRYTRSLNARRYTHGITSERIENEQLERELDAVIDTIIAGELQVACFPELLVDDHCLDYLCAQLAQRYIHDAAGKVQVPFFLLIAGSFHRASGAQANLRGDMPIVLFVNGARRDCCYSKLEPFQALFSALLKTEADHAYFPDVRRLVAGEQPSLMEHYAEEDIERNRGITIIDTGAFGKIGFAICKDVLPEQSLILARYGPLIDHLFVASLNFSDKADFKEVAVQLARKRKVATFYVNALSYDPGRTTPTFYINMKEGQQVVHQENDAPYIVCEIHKTTPKQRRGI